MKPAKTLLLLPLILLLQVARAEVPTAKYVELSRYLGLWYEIASIPQSFQKQCVSNTTAEYSTAESNRIQVLNACRTASGSIDSAEGRAKVVDSQSNSKLKVTFVKLGTWIFAFGGNYWILDIAPDYSLALVADPSTKYAWILSRTPLVEKSVLAGAEAKYKSAGYDTCKILTSVQDGGIQERKPLCEWVKQ